MASDAATGANSAPERMRSVLALHIEWSVGPIRLWQALPKLSFSRVKSITAKGYSSKTLSCDGLCVVVSQASEIENT